jgi:hypothetical protein
MSALASICLSGNSSASKFTTFLGEMMFNLGQLHYINNGVVNCTFRTTRCSGLSAAWDRVVYHPG